MSRRALVLVCAVLLAAAQGCAHRRSAASAAPSAYPSGASTERGKAVFARECQACHGPAGAGGPIGPPLKNERLRRSYAWVRAIVNDPAPPMPKLYPSRLTRTDVENVSAYVESL